MPAAPGESHRWAPAPGPPDTPASMPRNLAAPVAGRSPVPHDRPADPARVPGPDPLPDARRRNPSGPAALPRDTLSRAYARPLPTRPRTMDRARSLARAPSLPG